MTKAISIKQPYASAIILGHKTIENRTWQTSYRGTLAIHATGSMATSGFTLDTIRNSNWLGLTGDLNELPRSAILGTVELVDITTDDENIWTIPGSSRMRVWVRAAGDPRDEVEVFR